MQSVLLNSVRESVVSTDLENKVTFWNKGAEQLFGYSAEEAMGKHVASLIVPDGVNFVDAGKTDALRASGTWNSQVMRRRKDGSIIWTDVVVSIVTDAGGQRVRIPRHSPRRHRAAQGRGAAAVPGAAAR